MIFLSIADKLSDASELDRCLSEIAQGSAQALDELYKKTKTAVFAYSLSLLKNFHDAEDVAQDVFVTVYINAPAYSSVGKPMAWILTIARNLCYKKLGAGKRTDYLDSDEAERFFAEHAVSAETIAENKFFIEECLNNLSKTERDILVLHAVAGMKFREVAAFTEASLSSVLSVYHRTIKKIKNKYGSIVS